MRAKFILVLALGCTMMFSEGCNIQDLLAGMQPGGQPLGPLTQPGLGGVPGIPGIGQQPGPLDGSLGAGLPPFSPDPSAQTPGVPGLNPQAPANVPTAPTTPVDPNASTPPALAGLPQPVPVGTGPIDPASLPQLPALPVNNNPLALAPTVPLAPGM